MPVPGSTDPAAERSELAVADLVVVGRMPWSSNATFLCELRAPDDRSHDGAGDDDDRDDRDDAGEDEGDGVEPLGRAIYKPHRGERPLWDFPDGLYRREAGAYELARALGWEVVPETVVRDGPLGIGSVQRFVDADFSEHYFTLLDDPAHHPQLLRMAVFDLVANSTDRKGGHVLVDAAGHLWGIDNGLCLHHEPKLRTVIWDFAGDPLPADLAEDLDRFLARDLPASLAELLDPFERDALRARARAVLAEGRLPHDDTGHRHPWPLV